MPIAPTEAEIQDQLKKIIALYNRAFNVASVSGSTIIDLEGIVIEALETEFADEITSGIGALRSSLATGLDATAALTGILREYARFIDAPEAIDGPIQRVITRIYDHLVDTSQTVESRAFTYGTPVASSANTGNGQVLRLTVDADGFDLEAAHAEGKIIECVSDENNGAAVQEEMFELSGEDAPADSLSMAGSGLVEPLATLSARNSLLANPSFSLATGTATASGMQDLDTLTGWEDDTGDLSKLQIVSGAANTYRSFRGEGDAVFGLMFESTETIRQDFETNNIRTSPTVPYLLQVAYNRDAAGTAIITSGVGTIKITMGTASSVAYLSTASGWNVLRIAGTTDSWYDNFKDNDPEVTIQVTLTTGQVIVDDVILAGYSLVDGTYWAIVGGRTPFLLRDRFDVTDTLPGTVNAASIQFWLYRTFGRYWPSDPAPTITDP